CRISFSYHFRRNRDHNASEFALQYRVNRWRAIKQFPVRFLSRLWKLLSATFTLPFKGGQGVVSFATALGGVAGLLQACWGKQSLHYSKTPGF
ncbi:MAG: glycosyltransferase family 2 protein, partial [Brucella intermedia]